MMRTSVQARVNDAVEALYRVFAASPPEALHGCPCCLETRNADILLTTPLRQLTGQQLWHYVSGAFLTVGSENDFRYLLPRILDVSVNDPGNANDNEIVLGKLALANWRSWSNEEQRSIENLLSAWFELALERDQTNFADGWVGFETESLLCGVARAGLSLRPWLIRLHDVEAGPVLADLKSRYPDELSPFWEDSPEGFSELATILSQGRA